MTGAEPRSTAHSDRAPGSAVPVVDVDISSVEQVPDHMLVVGTFVGTTWGAAMPKVVQAEARTPTTPVASCANADTEPP